MNRAPALSWRETATVLAGCWIYCVLATLLLHLLDAPSIPIPPLLLAGLTQWFFVRHRYWIAGVVAACGGMVVAFTLLDDMRVHLDRITADGMTTAAAALVSLTLFTGMSRVTTI
ncbi:hypothetical protein [Streptomyces sp. NPDC051569]|uniref:hypothetical protein n=1 Tax=Streptomyces sp. NPDC051569 TaxID=3365661 RepID=UPI0037AC46ED